VNLTNYELLYNPGKVDKEIGERFRKAWWDRLFERADRRVFNKESHGAEGFYTVARNMHATWLKVWKAKGEPYGDCIGEPDFGAWLCKGADPGLLIPAGHPVKYVGSDAFGMTVAPDSTIMSGNYTFEHVIVETANGICHWQVEHVEPVSLPKSMLDFARAQAMKDFRCPMLGRGGEDGEQH
jgi:hypothetical protein